MLEGCDASLARRSRWIGAVVALVALVVAGCGGGSPSLDDDERLTIATFKVDVASTVVDGSGYGDLLVSIDEVIAIAREKPDAVYETSDGERASMRQVLSDAASDLQPYQPDLAAKLDRAVATLD